MVLAMREEKVDDEKEEEEKLGEVRGGEEGE